MVTAADFLTSFSLNGKNIYYYNLPEAAKKYGIILADLPYSLRVVFENLVRRLDGRTVKEADLQAIANWQKTQSSQHEIAYSPARVLMQDFTGVPAVVDLAAMRDAVARLGDDPAKINPQKPVDLVIDHSVMVDHFGNDSAFAENVSLEMERNKERYQFLKWGQQAFDNFRVVPPGTGICHQVNLEYLARVVWTSEENGKEIAYPDTVVGTDSHTTMINGLAVLGWGVGGIEAEASMLGQPISMLIPEVVGFELTGSMPEGTTATDVVLTVTQQLRAHGVVGKFVEFYGEGVSKLSLADRATLANMAPEYGATCGFFPIDQETLNYMHLSGRDEAQIALTKAYAQAQSLWRDEAHAPQFSATLTLDLTSVQPSIAGPKRPQDKINLAQASQAFVDLYQAERQSPIGARFSVPNKPFDLGHGDVVIAAITSCTNTSNPSVMLAAGLVAQKARALGISIPPWVKTSLAPGSQVVSEYLEKSGLQQELDGLGFNVVGYGCTTCIGNSGPLDPDIDQTIRDHKVFVTSVLSGNRNFEGRVHALTRGNYLMSPPLVVAYAIAGNTQIDITQASIAKDANGNDVYLKDIWPSQAEIADVVARCVTREMFVEKYANVFDGTPEWTDVQAPQSNIYAWDTHSTYIQHPPFFAGMTHARPQAKPIHNARIIALLGDSITTDHISPAGAIAANTPAAAYLQEHKVEPRNFNSYGSRRGNHEVMMRGTFANTRIRNQLAPGTEGGYTTHHPTGEVTSIYDAAMRYQQDGTPLVVIAGKEYGTGSSRDWAAKGTSLLGIRAVLAESFERIHRSNLIGMGVLPLQFEGSNAADLGLDGTETVSISGLEAGITPKMKLTASFSREDGFSITATLLCRIDTEDEAEYYVQEGILQHVIRELVGE